jgi:stage V sporulation protein AB
MFNNIFLAVFGLCGGGLVAAGLFAFINILGLIPRLAARTHTASQIRRYENWIVGGAVFGNLVNLHQVEFYRYLPEVDQWVPLLFSVIMGTFSGIFVGCLVMSLAETLEALPTMNRRIHLSVGIQYVIEALAVGKLVGSLVYFLMLRY